MIKKCINYPTVLILALLASLFSLAFALVSEYGFHLKPCELCIFQRIPYAVVCLLALLGLWKKRWARGIVLLVAFSFLIDSGIAFYHAGVEQHWFPGPEACTDKGGAETLTVEQILEKLRKSCDRLAEINQVLRKYEKDLQWPSARGGLSEKRGEALLGLPSDRDSSRG